MALGPGSAASPEDLGPAHRPVARAQKRATIQRNRSAPLSNLTLKTHSTISFEIVSTQDRAAASLPPPPHSLTLAHSYGFRMATNVTSPSNPDSGGVCGPNPKPRPAVGGSERICLSAGSDRSPICRFVHSFVTSISSLFAPGFSAAGHVHAVRRRPHHPHRLAVHLHLGNVAHLAQIDPDVLPRLEPRRRRLHRLAIRRSAGEILHAGIGARPSTRSAPASAR